jgi:hypothetical protein
MATTNLRAPPRLAHIQAVVLVVRDEDGVAGEARRIAAELEGPRRKRAGGRQHGHRLRPAGD